MNEYVSEGETDFGMCGHVYDLSVSGLISGEGID